MKNLKLVAVLLGLTVVSLLPARTTKECLHLVFRSDKFRTADKLPTTELLQSDFMAVAALASLTSNTMISKNNSAFRAALATVAALHGSAWACELWEKEGLSLAAGMAVFPAALANLALPTGWKFKDANLNKAAAVVAYLTGQNSVQILAFLKEQWKAGLLNPMPFIRLFTKNRDRSELVAIAVRNLVPLVLLTKNGAAVYSASKQNLIPA